MIKWKQTEACTHLYGNSGLWVKVLKYIQHKQFILLVTSSLQASGLFTSFVLLLVILFLGPYFESTPKVCSFVLSFKGIIGFVWLILFTPPPLIVCPFIHHPGRPSWITPTTEAAAAFMETLENRFCKLNNRERPVGRVPTANIIISAT